MGGMEGREKKDGQGERCRFRGTYFEYKDDYRDDGLHSVRLLASERVDV